jgi:hypothetical protein
MMMARGSETLIRRVAVAEVHETRRRGVWVPRDDVLVASVFWRGDEVELPPPRRRGT